MRSCTVNILSYFIELFIKPHIYGVAPKKKTEEIIMETENKYRGVATLVVVLFIAFFVVLETKLLAGGGSSQTVPGANGYNAGEYTGTGQGNNGEIKVKVTFSDTAIESVEVVEHSESAGICEPAMEQIPQEIVDAQTYNVDAVQRRDHVLQGYHGGGERRHGTGFEIDGRDQNESKISCGTFCGGIHHVYRLHAGSRRSSSGSCFWQHPVWAVSCESVPVSGGQWTNSILSGFLTAAAIVGSFLYVGVQLDTMTIIGIAVLALFVVRYVFLMAGNGYRSIIWCFRGQLHTECLMLASVFPGASRKRNPVRFPDHRRCGCVRCLFKTGIWFYSGWSWPWPHKPDLKVQRF